MNSLLKGTSRPARNIVLLSMRSAITRQVATSLSEVYGFERIRASKLPTENKLPAEHRFIITAGKSDLCPLLKDLGVLIFLNSFEGEQTNISPVVELDSISYSLALRAKAELLSSYSDLTINIDGLDYELAAERVFDAASQLFVPDEEIATDSRVA